MSDAYGILIWKHFKSVEVVIRLVRLYRISGRRVFFNVPPGNKVAVPLNPLTKEEGRRVYNGDDRRLSINLLNARVSKVCEIFKVCGIKSFKYTREFHPRVSVIVATFPHPKMWRWTKRTVIGCLTCRSNGLMGGPWPMKAVIYSRPSAISLKVWLRETNLALTLYISSSYSK